MSRLSDILLAIFIYVIAARGALLWQNPRVRSILFAAVNVAAFAWISMLVNVSKWTELTIIDLGTEAVFTHLVLIAGYVGSVIPGYFLMRRLANREDWLPWLAFFYPISLLIIVKYLQLPGQLADKVLGWDDWVLTLSIVGLSYMAFRLSYLVLEVRNGTVPLPTLAEYLGFAFFLPTLVVGPINPYSLQQRSIELLKERPVPIIRCLVRIVVGATKFLFLATLANQLTFAGIFLDEKPHALIDLPVAAIFYYIFLYLNFSGFCDIAVGIAGLLGIQVKENFNNPFTAKNVKDFWNRWHITLSEYTRDVIFAPLSKALIKKFGVSKTDLAISTTIAVVFLVIGVWHGVGWRFAVFGLIHAAGVIANHYYSKWLKKRLGRERYAAYNKNPFVNAVSIVLTFLYVSASFVVFANGWEMLGTIWVAIRDGI